MNADALQNLIISAGYSAQMAIEQLHYGEPPQIAGLKFSMELRSDSNAEVFTFSGYLSAPIDVYPMFYQLAATYIESKKVAK